MNSQFASDRDAWLPEIIAVGTIAIRRGQLVLSGWQCHDPDDIIDAPGETAGLSVLMGRSVAELHGLAHGRGCSCPVRGFRPDTGLLTLGYDERPPYLAARPPQATPA
jgi:hypothetical protein